MVQDVRPDGLPDDGSVGAAIRILEPMDDSGDEVGNRKGEEKLEGIADQIPKSHAPQLANLETKGSPIWKIPIRFDR